MTGTRRFLRLAMFLMFLTFTLIGVVPRGSALRAQPATAACNKVAVPETLQSLIDGAAAGDVICMAPGVYRGPVLFQNKRGGDAARLGHAREHRRGRRQGLAAGVREQRPDVRGLHAVLRAPVERVHQPQRERRLQSDGRRWRRSRHPLRHQQHRRHQRLVRVRDGRRRHPHPPRVERERAAQLGVQERRRRRVDGRRDGEHSDHPQHHLRQRRAGRVRGADAVRAAAAGLRRGAGVLSRQPAGVRRLGEHHPRHQRDPVEQQHGDRDVSGGRTARSATTASGGTT